MSISVEATPVFRRRRIRWDALQLPLSAIILLALWEGLVRWLGVPEYILPPPSSIAMSLVQVVESPLLYQNAATTLIETICGFGIAIVLGVLFAVLITESETCARIMYPYFAGLQSMPKVAIAPLIVIWFGFGLPSKIVLAALLAFFPMLVNAVEGLRAADSGRLKLMQALDASRWQTLRHVRLPYAMPFFLAGLELAGIYSMLGALVGEFVGAQKGIGYWLMAMNMNVDTSGSFALLVLLALYGITLQRIIGMIRRRTLFWAQTGRSPSNGAKES
jgi:NitT/TauT family transport system permease protein